MKISVAMAVYNGEKYIQEQIDSILSQLGKDDELIISIDKSIDNLESSSLIKLRTSVSRKESSYF